MPRFTDQNPNVPAALARPRPIEAIFLTGWPGGWQPDLPESDLEPNMIADIQNVDFTEGHGLQKRKGYEKMTTDIAGMDDASHIIIQPVQTLDTNYPRFEQIVFYFNLNDGELYYQSLGELVLEDVAPATGTDLVDSTHSIGDWRANFNGPRPWAISAFTFGTTIYITSQRTGGTSANGVTLETQDGTADGNSFAIKFNAQNFHTGGTIITRPGVHQLDGDTTGVPNCRAAIAIYDRVFYANLSSFDAAQPSNDPSYQYRSRVYWSDPGTAETIQATSYVVVGADDDGSDIVALVPFRSTIAILKIDSFWTLTGTDEDSFSLYQVSNDMGCTSTHAAVANEEHLFFFDPTRGVMQYDGVRFLNISEPINDTMLGELNRYADFKTNMWLDSERLYVSIPVGDISAIDTDLPTKTYVFDFRLKTWTNYTIGFVPGSDEYKLDTYVAPASAAVPDGLFYGGIYNVVGVNRLATTDSDDTAAINAFVETAWFNPGDVGDKHRLRRLEVTAEPDGDAVAFSLYRNFDGTTAWKTGTMTPTGTLDGWHEQQDHYATDFWTWLKFRFTNAVAGETFTINGIGLNYSSRRILRGELTGLNQ